MDIYEATGRIEKIEQAVARIERGVKHILFVIDPKNAPFTIANELKKI